MSDESLNIPVIGTGLSGDAVITTNQVVYVMKNGSDETGEPYSLHKPYLTLEAARTAASSGDTIVVYPGWYLTSLNLAKNNVRWHFLTSTAIEFTGSGHLFDTTELSDDTIITGNGGFYSETGGLIKHAVNSLLFEFYECIGASETGALDLSCNGHTKNINVKGKYRVIESSPDIINNACILLTSVDDEPINATINIPYVLSLENNAFHVSATSLTDSIIVNCVNASPQISANTGVWNINGSERPDFLVIGGHGSNLQINGKLSKLQMYIGCFVSFNGYSNETILSSPAARLVGGTHGSLTLEQGEINNATISNMADITTISIVDGTAVLNVDGSIEYSQSGGLCTLFSNDIYSESPLSTIDVSAGKLILKGTYYQSSCSQFITMSEDAFVDLSDCNIYMKGTSLNLAQTAVSYNGGLLSINGAKIVMNNPSKSPIVVYTTDRDCQILSKGFNTNYLESFNTGNNGYLYIQVLSIGTTIITIHAVAPGVNLTLPFQVNTLGISTVDELTTALQDSLTQFVDPGLTPFTATAIGPTEFYLTTTQTGGSITVASASENISHELVQLPSYGLTNTLEGNIIQNVNVI